MDRIQAILDLLARTDTAWPSHLAYASHALEAGQSCCEWDAGDARTRWYRRWRCSRCGGEWSTDLEARHERAAAVANREACMVKVVYQNWSV